MKKYDNPIASSSKTQFEDSDDEHESSCSEIRELADVTIEEMLKARSDGSHSVYKKPNQEKKSGRLNKNRPSEVSSKKPVSRLREVIQAPKRVIRDPRFESLCGTFDAKQFRSKYNFLFKKYDPEIIEKLRKQLRKSNDPEVIGELKSHLSWIDKQLKSDSTRQTEAAILAEHKKKEREAAKKGKQPFYLSKTLLTCHADGAETYEWTSSPLTRFFYLQASGKLDAFIEKRRRKNAAKDHRYMPYRRSNDSEQ
ncbi:hypothetical protein FH972_012106 [Carpinus fangiana]|uniref:rRNA biogenesis protein RRP36 n=1 Tax=Carpinus fangiana TaxID=176857 RepID=A0A5N6R5X3_9ROSI|nr:hypothetical protein FH972_012106 [Carpinus fangiana]